MRDKKTVSLDRGWGILLKDLDIEPENVLRRSGLPRDLLAQEQARLTVDEYFALWNALEEEAADPLLPVRIGEAVSSEVFSPPIFAALCSPDLAVATKRMAQYKKLVAPMTLEIVESEKAFSVEKKWDAPTLIPPRILAAVELVVLVRIARIGTREAITPVKVETQCALEPKNEYQEFFGVVPKKTRTNRVTFSAADAHRPFLTASESVWQSFEPELQRRLTKLEASAPLPERVRSVLLESLPSGEASVDIVASRLGLSARALQRKLKPAGTSFKEIVNKAREQLARHYVTNTNLNYAEISFLIGFEEPTSFFRAFREWTGKTPESVRAG